MFILNKNMMMVVFLITIIVISVLTAAPKKADNFTLPDVAGKEHSLSDYKDTKAIVLMFIATRCPVSNAYNERMVDLFTDYQDKKIAFLAINSNKQEDVNEVKEHAQKNEFEFPVLKDKDNKIADAFKAEVTPEIFVLNSSYEILYHGRIDDSQRVNQVKSKDLRNALNDILAGNKVSLTETKAFGCTIKKVTK